jgi:dolichyl-phosphate-mannose-protein mannosyltransferase
MTNPRIRTWLTAALLAAGALAFFLAGIANARSMVFDEKAYIESGNAILAGKPDPTMMVPPLGKLLIAAGIRLAGNNPLGWRLLSTVCGALTLAGVFLILELVLENYQLALVGALLALLNNFLYIMSRTAMVDIFLVVFALWGLVAFVAALQLKDLSDSSRRVLLACSGIFFGFAIAAKWNGVDELAVVALLGGVLFLHSKSANGTEFARYARNLRQVGLAWFAICFMVFPLLSYASTFWILDRRLGIPFSAAEFVSQNYWIWRVHSTEIANIGLSVPCYKWPLMVQPTRALSYLVGNWFVMWAGLVALLYCLLRFGRSFPETLLVALYGMNMLQWMVTPQHSIFYYYYFAPAMVVGMAIPVALQRLPERCFGVRLSVVAVLPAFCVFVYCFAHMAHLGAPYDTMLGYWV